MAIDLKASLEEITRCAKSMQDNPRNRAETRQVGLLIESLAVVIAEVERRQHDLEDLLRKRGL